MAIDEWMDGWWESMGGSNTEAKEEEVERGLGFFFSNFLLTFCHFFFLSYIFSGNDNGGIEFTAQRDLRRCGSSGDAAEEYGCKNDHVDSLHCPSWSREATVEEISDARVCGVM